jgi:hypothetical protein
MLHLTWHGVRGTRQKQPTQKQKKARKKESNTVSKLYYHILIIVWPPMTSFAVAVAKIEEKEEHSDVTFF